MDGKVGNDEVGTVKPWSLLEVPYGWKECNGQEISRDKYNDLFKKFRTQHVSNTSTITLLTQYGAGDGSTTFNLPDYQETALVGVGENLINTTSIPNHETYSLGQFRNDAVKYHKHGRGTMNITGGAAFYTMYDDHGGCWGSFWWDTSGAHRNPSNSSSSGVASFDASRNWVGLSSVPVDDNGNSITTSNSNRGKRKGVKYIIKVSY